ncbi:MAG: pyruvate kinase [Candidatus Paceibacterota bacterium]
MNKKTKIIATLGPASSSKETIKELIESGVNIFRLNFSHGSHEEHLLRLKMVRAVANEAGVHIGVLQDLGGPKIRIGSFETETVTLERGAPFALTTEDVMGTAERVSINYKKLPEEVEVGGRLMLDDGKVELKVESVEGNTIHTVVVHGGEITSRRGVNAPGAHLSIETLTDKDKRDLRFSPDEPVDFVALSFVRSREDIEDLRRELASIGSDAAIVAKIETTEAIDRIESIIEATDIVMVARGDLAVEIPTENVPFQQKKIITKCRELGRPVIVATQMFETMIENPVPTRAEVSDVANAILDGTDAIMLSGETAVGKYPVAAVRTMTRIALHTEKESAKSPTIYQELSEDGTGAITSVLLELSVKTKAVAIVTLTQRGLTAQKISRHRPYAPIVALTPNVITARKLVVAYGVEPLIIENFTSLDDLLERTPKILVESGYATEGSHILLTTGTTFGVSGSTNTVIVLRV